MKRLVLVCAVTVALSGCALTSTYTIDSSGGITGTTSFGVPKSAVHNVTTIEQWAQVLQDNNLSTPTPSPVVSTSGLPAPAVSCGPGEDLANNQWTYSCSVSGELSALSYADFSELSGQSAFSGFDISRVGTTVTLTQPATSTTGDSGSGFDFGLKGISLFYTNSTLSFPGTVGEVTGGAVKVDEHTVSFPSDGSQSAAMTATVEIPNLVGTGTNLTLDAVGNSPRAGSADVLLTSQLAVARGGKVEFFDGDVSLGLQPVDESGAASFVAKSATVGSHTYKATFLPMDWWHFDQAGAQAGVNLKVFQVSKAVTLSGVAKVGGKLKVGSISSTPAAGSISYQWLRNGQPISGQTGIEHRVVAADVNKSLSARITLRKTGTLSLVLASKSVKVAKK